LFELLRATRYARRSALRKSCAISVHDALVVRILPLDELRVDRRVLAQKRRAMHAEPKRYRVGSGDFMHKLNRFQGHNRAGGFACPRVDARGAHCQAVRVGRNQAQRVALELHADARKRLASFFFGHGKLDGADHLQKVLRGQRKFTRRLDFGDGRVLFSGESEQLVARVAAGQNRLMPLARLDIKFLAAQRADKIGQQACGQSRRAVLADKRGDTALHPLLKVAAHQAQGVALRFQIQVAQNGERSARRRRARHNA
jgi:hypothetical protein